MEDQFKVVVFFLIVGIILAALTARPETQYFVDERSVDSYSNMLFTYSTIRYPTQVEVVDIPRDTLNFTLGVNVDTDMLDFSAIMMGGSVKRQINLSTRDGKPSKIMVKAYGSIAPFLSFDKNNFLLHGQDHVFITLDTQAYPTGNYSGEVDVIVQRSNSGIMQNILGY